MNNFPTVFACYDTLLEEYIYGARGQLIFSAVGSLKVSVMRYNNQRAYNFLKGKNSHNNLIEEYEFYLKAKHKDNGNPTLRKKLADLFEIIRSICVDVNGPYRKEFHKFGNRFDDQSRFVIHTIESVVVKEV